MHPGVRRLRETAFFEPAYRMVRKRRIRRIVDSYQGRVVHHVYGGVPLTVALRDPLGEGWYDHDWAPQPELTFLLERSRLRGGARVFDLGAHHGVVALMCAAHVGDGLVVAVEAEPHNAAVASENARLNAGLPLLVEHAAVAAQSGTLWFSEGLNGAVRGGGRAGKVPVPAVTIDELAKRHGWPDVVLIDVEGFEGRAIEGASDVLAIGKTDFCIEIHDAATLGPHGWDSRQLTDHLVACGATVWIAPAYDQVAGEFAPVESASVEWDRRLFCVALFD